MSEMRLQNTASHASLFDLISSPIEDVKSGNTVNNKTRLPETVIQVDGKMSVEHQLDIHVNDLLQMDLPNGPTSADILSGIRYVMDYRIKNGRLLHLEPELCARLAQAFLRYTNLRMRPHGGSFLLGKKLTKEADLAFELFNEFLEEVYEFREAVGEIPLDELRRKLLFYPRLVHPQNPEEFLVAVNLLRTLTKTFPQFSEWYDFFKEEDWAAVEKALASSAFYSQEPRRVSLKPIICYPPQSLYFDREIYRVVDMFQTSAEEGLSPSQVAIHREYYGQNVLPAPKAKSIGRMILDQLTDFMIMVLICTMIISAIMDFPKVTSAAVLAVVIISNVIIGFWQEWKAAKTVKALKSLSIPKARVIRGGAEDVLCASELVPGDVVVLGEGDFVPADLRLIKVNRLEIIECNLTGETEAVPKNTLAIKVKSRKIPISKCNSNAFMSTLVSRGSAIGIVVRVGEATEIGKINSALAEEASLSPAEAKSPLQRKLSRLGLFLVILAVSLSVVVALAGIAWGKSFREMLPVAISLAVSVIPEGLVAVVTVTMAIGVSRLAKQQAIVRKMPAVETLGAVTTICSDKTGTLTEGRMRVRVMKSTTALKGPNGPLDSDMIPWIVTNFCNNAALSLHTDGTTEFTGDNTEIALLEASQEYSGELKVLPTCLRLIEIPFDSDRKMMSIVLKPDASEMLRYLDRFFFQSPRPLAYILTKGAPEVLVSKCGSYLDGSSLAPVDDIFNALISNEVDAMSGTGLRVLSLAVKPIYEEAMLVRIKEFEQDTEAELDTLYKDIEADLTLVGIIGLQDPPRAGVSQSIQDCFNAGIKVCMITGDHLRTAISIAKELGIFCPNDPQRCRAMRGDDLDVLSDEAIASMNPFPVVFARVSPQNKLSIVKALQSRGEIVIMTGDGVNDAPAISKADVGIAMGQSGTEISKDAADIILLDDNFYTILKAVHGGRLIYSNILKFLVYLLACNSAEIWTVLVAALVNVPVPLSAINILWANIIADVPPSMSLGMEPAEEGLLAQRPRNIKKGVLSLRNWILILLEGFLLSACSLGVYFWNYHKTRPPIVDSADPVLIELRSEAFFMLTGLQLILALFSRSTKASVFATGIFGNKYLVGAVALSFGLLVMGHYTPGLNAVLELRPIDTNTWLLFGIACLILFLGTELVKFFLRFSF